MGLKTQSCCRVAMAVIYEHPLIFMNFLWYLWYLWTSCDTCGTYELPMILVTQICGYLWYLSTSCDIYCDIYLYMNCLWYICDLCDVWVGHFICNKTIKIGTVWALWVLHSAKKGFADWFAKALGKVDIQCIMNDEFTKCLIFAECLCHVTRRCCGICRVHLPWHSAKRSYTVRTRTWANMGCNASSTRAH